MGKIVAAVATVHAPQLFVRPPTEVPEQLDADIAAMRQIGKDIEAIHLNAPSTPAGELEVRLDRCDGAPAAVLPLAPAAGNDAVTELPAVALPLPVV